MVLATHEMALARDVATQVCFLDGAGCSSRARRPRSSRARDERTRRSFAGSLRGLPPWPRPPGVRIRRREVHRRGRSMSDGALVGPVLVAAVVCLVPVACRPAADARLRRGRTDELQVLPGREGQGPAWNAHPPRRPR